MADPTGANTWVAPDASNTGAWATDNNLITVSWNLKRAFLDCIQYCDDDALVHSNMRMLTDDDTARAILCPTIDGTNPVEYGPVHCWQVSLKEIDDTQLSLGLKGMNKRIYTFLIVGYKGIADVGTHTVVGQTITNTVPSEISIEDMTGQISVFVAQNYRALVNFYGSYSVHIVEFPKWMIDYQNFETLGNILVHRVRGEFVVELDYSRDPNGGPLGA